MIRQFNLKLTNTAIPLSIISSIQYGENGDVFPYRYSKSTAPQGEIKVDGYWQNLSTPNLDSYYIVDLNTPKIGYIPFGVFKITPNHVEIKNDNGVYFASIEYDHQSFDGWGFTKESATDMAFRFLSDFYGYV